MRLLTVVCSLSVTSIALLVFAGCAAIPATEPGIAQAVATEVVERTVPINDAGENYTLPAPAEGEEGLDPDSPPFAWIDRGDSISMTTWGSSSCPAVPASIDVVAADRIVVNIKDSKLIPCTMDMSPHTSRIELPDDVNGLPLTISIDNSEQPDAHRSSDYVLE